MNSRIIEIIGPPGVGKSTIYKSLCKTWNPQSNWTYPDVLLAKKQPPLSGFSKWMEYKLRKLLGKKLGIDISIESGLRFADQYQELANFCWNHFSNSKVYNSQEINKRFRSAYFLFADFCRYQAILEKSITKFCIIEEGFLQKSYLVFDDQEFLDELLNKYLCLLPLPYSIIHIDTPNERVIFDRLRSRNKVIASQIGKNDTELLKDVERWQNTLNIILEKLKSHNVSVLRLNGENPVDENVYTINEMLNNSVVSSNRSLLSFNLSNG